MRHGGGIWVLREVERTWGGGGKWGFLDSRGRGDGKLDLDDGGLSGWYVLLLDR